MAHAPAFIRQIAGERATRNPIRTVKTKGSQSTLGTVTKVLNSAATENVTRAAAAPPNRLEENLGSAVLKSAAAMGKMMEKKYPINQGRPNSTAIWR
jgi:hypothetical protein